jgi:hypothetical protein
MPFLAKLKALRHFDVRRWHLHDVGYRPAKPSGSGTQTTASASHSLAGAVTDCKRTGGQTLKHMEAREPPVHPRRAGTSAANHGAVFTRNNGPRRENEAPAHSISSTATQRNMQDCHAPTGQAAATNFSYMHQTGLTPQQPVWR